MPSDTPLRVQSDDPEYRRLLQAEADFWDKPHFFCPGHQQLPPAAYWNEAFTGDPALAWHESIPRYGDFRRGCSLGTSLNQQRDIMAQNPNLHLTVYDISEGSLATIESEVAARFPGRVRLERADLNFLALPADEFDLIVSNSVLHHLLNIEHVARQVQRALAPGGYLFLNDYVGETRLLFRDDKRRAFEAALREIGARDTRFRNWSVEWPDPDSAPPGAFAPFEAVRSEDTLDVLRLHLDEQFVRPAGALLGLLLFARPPFAHRGLPVPGASVYRRARFALGRIRRRLLQATTSSSDELAYALAELLAPYDRVATEEGLLLPMFAFAGYRKGST